MLRWFPQMLALFFFCSERKNTWAPWKKLALPYRFSPVVESNDRFCLISSSRKYGFLPADPLHSSHFKTSQQRVKAKDVRSLTGRQWVERTAHWWHRLVLNAEKCGAKEPRRHHSEWWLWDVLWRYNFTTIMPGFWGNHKFSPFSCGIGFRWGLPNKI